MLSRIFRIMLSFTAVSPIFVSLAFVALRDKNWVYMEIFIALFLASMGIAYWIIEESKRRLAEIKFPIKKAKTTDKETISFCISYALPIIFKGSYQIDFISWFFTSFILIAVLFITNSMPVNPVLSLLGYHFYDVDTRENVGYTLITKKHITQLSQVTHAVQIGPYAFLEV